MDEQTAVPDGTFADLMSLNEAVPQRLDPATERPVVEKTDGPDDPPSERSNGQTNDHPVQRTDGRTTLRQDDRTGERTIDRADDQKNDGTDEQMSARPHGRKTGRTKDRSDERTAAAEYAITVPFERQKARQAFDIFRDQKFALDKLQLAMVDAGYKRPKLGDLIQEALDLYILRKARELPNVRIERQKEAK